MEFENSVAHNIVSRRFPRSFSNAIIFFIYKKRRDFISAGNGAYRGDFLLKKRNVFIEQRFDERQNDRRKVVFCYVRGSRDKFIYHLSIDVSRIHVHVNYSSSLFKLNIYASWRDVKGRKTFL